MEHPAGPIVSIRLARPSGEIALGLGEHLVGRSSSCAVQLEDPVTSRQHAAIIVTADAVTIRDLGSRSGVFVNGDEIEGAHVLAEGDLLSIGSHVFKVVAIPRAAAAQASAQELGPMTSTSIGRIAVVRRAVPNDATHAKPITSTTLGERGPVLNRPLGAYALIAEAASQALAEGRIAQSEKILRPALVDVLATVHAGKDIDDTLIELAVNQALALAEATGKRKWVDYVRDLYTNLRISIPPPVARRIARVISDAT